MPSSNDSDSGTLIEPQPSTETEISPNTTHIPKTKPIEDDETFVKTNTNGLTIPDGDLRDLLASRRKLHFRDIQAAGPSRRFHPTSVRVDVEVEHSDQDEQYNEEWNPQTPFRTPGISRATTKQSGKSMNTEVSIMWRSRDNRKGRNSVVVNKTNAAGESLYPKSRKRQFDLWLKTTSLGMWRMCYKWMYWDLAWWSGWSYSIGSILFVLDGAFAWMPIAYPDKNLDFGKDTVSLLFFIGAILYQIGATTAYLEAVNDGSFPGSPMKRFLEGNETDHRKIIDEKIGHLYGNMMPLHHRKERRAMKDIEKRAGTVDPEIGWMTRDRAERPGSIYPPGKKPAPRRGGMDLGADIEAGESTQYLTWRWWPTWRCLWTYHIFEIGYIANVVQLPAATLYGVVAVVGLPGVYDQLDQQWKVNVAYWIPQIVASVGFLLAGLLFMLETQAKWYKPEPKVLGWWVGVWAAIGSVGFLLSAAFGPGSYDNSGAAYQSPLQSMWGSGAYLVSSLIQWYEAVNKNPVVEIFNEPGRLETYQIHGL